MPPTFLKFHGFGNDYIVIEQKELVDIAPSAEAIKLGEFARRICNRHYGAGADGIAVISPVETQSADFHVRIFNPDGSEAGLSGNGTRCAASYLYYKQLWSAEELRLSTRSGVKLYTLRSDSGAGHYVFDSELGQPKFDPGSIPMLIDEPLEKVIDYPLDVEGTSLRVTALQMGNPNCCVFVDGFDALDWRMIGRKLENHSKFPDRTNVVFIRVEDRQTISLRIWERGVGETEASGSCSCAAAVAAMINGKTDRQVTVLMPGGEAKIQWRGNDDLGEVVITGTAEVIYSGNWLSGSM
jgi:diaminopimelate epimerase